MAAVLFPDVLEDTTNLIRTRGDGLFNERVALMVCQIEASSNPLDKPRVDLTVEFLLKVYPPEHVVTLLWTDGLPEYKTQENSMALKDLIREYSEAKFFASLYVPPLA
jgi:hypothetical protein